MCKKAYSLSFFCIGLRSANGFLGLDIDVEVPTVQVEATLDVDAPSFTTGLTAVSSKGITDDDLI